MNVSEADSKSRRPSVAATATPQAKPESTDGVSVDHEAKRVKTAVYGLLSIGIGVVGIAMIAFASGVFERGNRAVVESPTRGPVPAAYNAERAMGYLKQLCALGPRPSGSAAMNQQQQMLMKFFTDQGASVSLQRFTIRHPQDGSDVTLANLIATWGPDRPKRFVLCAHYDTRPYPDKDRRNPKGVFVGANDGASGTAALMEISHQLGGLPPDVGVDIVLFDGEEFVFQQGRDDYFLGSTFYAKKYAAQPPAIRHQAGILLDMIGDKELKIYYEKNSMRLAGDVAKSIWKTASDLGVVAFVPRSRHEVQDDHLPLNQIAKIPTVDLIDFDYPRPGFGVSYWHTEQDRPENCSGTSIAAVVWVVDQWLKSQ